MTYNRKGPPGPAAIDSMTHREKVVLQVLSDADEPLDHKQICMRITEPWYEKRTSFRASVSSTLGIMRSKGLIKARQIPTGDAPIRTQGYHMITPTIRVWAPNGFRSIRAVEAVPLAPVIDQKLSVLARIRHLISKGKFRLIR